MTVHTTHLRSGVRVDGDVGPLVHLLAVSTVPTGGPKTHTGVVGQIRPDGKIPSV